MRRITIRNLKSQKPVKPRLFDAIIVDDTVYFDVKVGNKGNEVISLNDILDQIKRKGSAHSRTSEGAHE